MAPSAAELKAALVQGTRDVFEAEPEAISVNKVRKHVEEELGLEDGFFTEGKWKQTSKTLIKELVDELMDANDTNIESETKAGTKRQSPKAESPQAKRQKRTSGTTKKVVAKKKHNAEVSDVDEPDDAEANSKRKRKSVPKKKAVDSDASEGSEQETKPRSKKTAARRKAKPIADSDEELESDSIPKSKPVRQPESESEVEDPNSGGQSGVDEKLVDTKEDADKDDTEMDGLKDALVGASVSPVVGGGPQSDSQAAKEAQAMEEDEYSDVIDEPPATKSRKKGSKETSSKTKASRPAASKKKAASVPDDAQEAEIKKLQTQLSKCGIRKFWVNEFKQYGDDSRAKIRHLKKMLADIGMNGRFSEAKAREIKETRELLADVEAAQEMNKLWGLSSGERASRSKSKGKPAKVELKDDSVSEDNDDDKEEDKKDVEDEDEDEGPTSFAARRRRAHADLAFLGDDSDSE